MYRLMSLNNWFNGMRFDSLTAAIAKAKKCQNLVDVVRDEDNTNSVIVWSNPDYVQPKKKFQRD